MRQIAWEDLGDSPVRRADERVYMNIMCIHLKKRPEDGMMDGQTDFLQDIVHFALGLLQCIESPKSKSVQQGKDNALCRELLAPGGGVLLTYCGRRTDKLTDGGTDGQNNRHISMLFP